jgi:probable O-glycosylation ligase (exosortase A-associated)
MRDVIVLAIILGSSPICLFSPYYGILVWTWIAYFNPHRFTYGIAYHFPVAVPIAVPTIVGTIFTRQKNRGIFTVEFLLLLALWAWFGVATYASINNPVFAGHADDTLTAFIGVSKIMLMAVLTVVVVTTEERLRSLLTLTALCFGALAIKGALFGARTGGQFRFYGPPESFLEDNNMLALAMNMILPMMFFLARSEGRRWLRRLLWASFYCAIGGILLSYSRGALLGLAVTLGMIAIKSRKKALAGILMLVLAFLVLTFAPPAWMERMSNFFHGNLDESAELRLNAWKYSWTLAMNYPLTGGGFETYTPELYERFTPSLRFAGPHSIYFQMLGEQGFVGLGLFLTLIITIFVCTQKLRRRARGQPGLEWVQNYTQIIQIGLVAFLVSGAFLARAYFDLFYLFVASAVLIKIFYRKEVALQAHAVVLQPAPVGVAETVYS